MNCINCKAEVHSKFCPNCGQKADVKRIDFKEGWLDFWSRVYGLDGMLPNTLRDLTQRPGAVTKAFIEGNRTKYYGPVGYFFIMISMVLIVISLLNIDVLDFLKDGNSLSPLHPKIKTNSEAFIGSIMRFVSDYVKFISFAIIPLQAFTSRYLVFRKSELNYVEHSVLPFYVQGHLYWLTILKVIDYKLFGNFIPHSIFVATSLFYFGYAYSNFIQYQPKWKSFFKGLMVFFTAQIMFMLIVGIILIILIWISPDFYEMIKPSNNK